MLKSIIEEKNIDGMHTLTLPPMSHSEKTPHLPHSRQLTIIGASGAGKTRFMSALQSLNGDRAYCLSAVSAPFPEREESVLPGSIDVLYREVVGKQPYMRTDAVSELDKLVYMLFIDEVEHLLMLKEQHESDGKLKKVKPTRLDRLSRLWQRVFPGNRIVRKGGCIMFATGAGEDLITASDLSQGEQTVLYYAAGVLFAMQGAIIFIDSPSLFVHPTILNNLWNSIEELRPDCTFVYNSVDVQFVSSRTRNVSIWVKSYSASDHSWDYEVLAPGKLPDDIFIDLIGSRRPVMFIEGDMNHSIDAKLYPLVFSDFTVRPLGSCNKVIETTRSFNDLRSMHHLKSRGVVDRDRRTEKEVEYLRRKSILVADVAEVENLFLLEDVIKIMAVRRGKNPQQVFKRIAANVEKIFYYQLDKQVLQHVRHRIKREVECKIDQKFSCITALETHLKGLIKLLNPRQKYNEINTYFLQILRNHDYGAILKVFNHKPMLGECGITKYLDFHSPNDYISGVLSALKENGEDAKAIRKAITNCFDYHEMIVF